MPCPTQVAKLIEKFELHREAYHSAGYKEAQLRQEFIDPLFQALGWDMDNAAGKAEAYKDVIHEDAIKLGGGNKAPDYCFRIGGTRKFFVEAKKPAANIKEDSAHAFQLRRYAWSSKLPLSILTTFEDLAVYDCRVKPAKDDKPSAARVLLFHYTELPDRWDELAGIFSKDAIEKGSFDKFAESTKKKRGTAEVDAAFLAEIESWRLELAKNLALRNPQLDQRDLNFAVQRVIDRIIFLRIAEDRGIEDYGRLQSLLNMQGVYRKLGELFRSADDRYNSGLFHFEPEKGRSEPPDELTLDLEIDDKVLKEIIRHLYYPDSPYEFSVLSADILGQVYEQFLGKVIKLTAGHRAQVEEKPEVRKAGGVYYTPTYIVDYIVQQTVAKLLGPPTPKGATSGRGLPDSEHRLTPKQAAKLKILDPACGSGSFLIGAYQHLLDWHRDWYLADGPEKHRKEIYQDRSNQWRLTIGERKRILLNNIYGVDIDPQAVEVTKLSLCLKVLENANRAALDQQLKIFHKDRALPDLGANIKCGNSLIGPDFYNGQQMSFFDEDERYRINVFDWSGKDGFPHIMKSGGFDAVIGNPPYGFHQIHQDYVKNYFKSKFVSSGGSFEHYFLFMEAALRLLRKTGTQGFITPVTWLSIPSAQSLRTFVLDNFAITSIAWLPELVFKDAQVNTAVSIIERQPPEKCRVLISLVNDPRESLGALRTYDQKDFITAGYLIRIFEESGDTALLSRIETQTVALSSLTRPCSGYNPYEVGKGKAPGGRPQSAATVEERPYHSSKRVSKEWKPEIGGADLRRYWIDVPRNRFIKYGPWLAAARDPTNFLGLRILVQEITGGERRRIVAAHTADELYYSRDVIPIKCDLDWPSPLFLLGIINSWFITWRHHRRSPKAKKALFPKLLVRDLAAIPIPNVHRDSKQDVKRHDQLVTLVKHMLALQAELAATKPGHARTVLERQIEATDRQIDSLVYRLYSLTPAEIALVESATQ